VVLTKAALILEAKVSVDLNSVVVRVDLTPDPVKI
jgi:hypothetical protein